MFIQSKVSILSKGVLYTFRMLKKHRNKLKKMARQTVNLTEQEIETLKGRIAGYGNSKKMVEETGLSLVTLHKAIKSGRVSGQSKTKLDKVLVSVSTES